MAESEARASFQKSLTKSNLRYINSGVEYTAADGFLLDLKNPKRLYKVQEKLIAQRYNKTGDGGLCLRAKMCRHCLEIRPPPPSYLEKYLRQVLK